MRHHTQPSPRAIRRAQIAQCSRLTIRRTQIAQRSLLTFRRTLIAIAIGLGFGMHAAVAPDSVRAQVTLGFRESFNGSSDWGGGALVLQEIAGGQRPPTDGFLSVTTFGVQNLGCRTFSGEYAGDWTAAGITELRVWLNDIGDDDPLQIHFGIGTVDNRWLYIPGFEPPHHQWGEFVVDLTNPANWIQIISDGGTFAQALQSVGVIQFRHDLDSFMQQPDPLQGDFGVDEILLTNSTVGVEPRADAPARALELAAPFPNPSRGPVTFAIAQFQQGPVTLEILDVSGRRVRRAAMAQADPGPRTWMWDGTDDHGARVAPGAYRVRASDAAGAVSRALVRVN